METKDKGESLHIRAFPTDLKVRLEIRAATERKTMKQVVIDAIKAHLK